MSILTRKQYKKKKPTMVVPSGSLVFYSAVRSSYWFGQFLYPFIEWLDKEGFDVRIATKKERSPFGRGLTRQTFIYNETTKLYSIIAHFDSSIRGVKFAKYPNIEKILKCQYSKNAWYYTKPEFRKKVVPFIYLPKSKRMLESFAKKTKLVPMRDRSDKIFFRGARPSMRFFVLGCLSKKGYLQEEEAEALGFRSKKNMLLYFKEMMQYKLCISMPGHANMNHREIECFALGCPVIMPELKTQMYDPLILNKHYVSVDLDWSTVTRRNHVDAASMILKRYKEVINDLELLNRIATNARKWYKKNVASPGCFRLARKLLNIDKKVGGQYVYIDS